MSRIENVRGFDERTSATDVVAGLDLSGKRAIVTGAAGAMGREIARALASVGADVTLGVRDLDRGDATAREIRQAVRTDRVRAVRFDLDDIASVDGFVAGWDAPLDILVNNAAVMATPERYTASGWELQFATNHLGHFALAVGLVDALAAGGAGRVVSVSSSGHNDSPIVFDDLFFLRRAYDPTLAYAQSKTANVLFAVEATSRLGDLGITANACMPGGVWSGLQKHWDPDVLEETKRQAGDVAKSPDQGAATAVLLATAPELDGIGGRYFEDCHEAEVVDEIADGLHGVRSWALDPATATRLWDVSVALIDAERRRTKAGS